MFKTTLTLSKFNYFNSVPFPFFSSLTYTLVIVQMTGEHNIV